MPLLLRRKTSAFRQSSPDHNVLRVEGVMDEDFLYPDGPWDEADITEDGGVCVGCAPPSGAARRGRPRGQRRQQPSRWRVLTARFSA